MRIFLLLFFVITSHALCSDLNKYHQSNNGFKVDLSHPPIKDDLQKFLQPFEGIYLPDPVLSSYFAHETRFIADHAECFNDKDQLITYSLNGSIYISEGDQSNSHLKKSLLSLASLFDEITKEVLYAPNKIYISAQTVSPELIRDYNFECVQYTRSIDITRDFMGIFKINSTECERMLIVRSNSGNNVFEIFQRMIFYWID